MRPSLVVAFVLGMLVGFGCRDDEGPIKEPVVTENSNPTYGEDPDLGATNNRSQNTGSQIENDANDVINDPFAADAPPIIEGNENLIANATPDNEDSIPEMDEVYGNALSDNHEVSKRELNLFPNAEADKKPSKKVKKKTKKSAKKKTGKTAANTKWHYVKPILLNVRSGPSLKAPVVRRLLGGARVRVRSSHPRGFVKILPGQYVRAKYLSTSPTKRVTRAQAERAWKQK